MNNHRPEKHECITRYLIDRNAERQPDKTVLKFDTGQTYTNDELKQKVYALAQALQNLGVRQHDLVLVWLPNGPLSVTLLLALNTIGAVFVPFNTAYKGGVLSHVIKSSKASLMIADDRLLERLESVETAELRTIVCIGSARVSLPGIELLSEAVLDASLDSVESLTATLSPLEKDIVVTDTHLIIFTSGTTGPSKGVLCSYQHTWRTALEFRHVGPEDCSLVALPMFHIGGVLGIFFALIHGGSSALVSGFSTSKFWPTVKDMDVTTVGLLGAMVQFLMKQPLTENEKDHPVKTAVIAPYGDEALQFADRFGVEVFTEFNMTELSVPLFCGPNPTIRGTCGSPREGVTLRLVDSHGEEVQPGVVGELLVRPDHPYDISHGYLNNPEATAEAWQDGWFYTGDLFYRDVENNYFFVDRLKDMIRRRGENISSFEVEAEVLAHPLVREVAAVGVSNSNDGEGEVLIVIATVENQMLAPEELLSFLRSRLAHFMLPRYIRCMDELPKTPTQKVEKHLLRKDGITADTWDREAAGIIIKRQKLTEQRHHD